MNRENAEEFTASVGQIASGMWRQVAWAHKQGIPQAMGLSTAEWVKRLGGYVKLDVGERREAVAELAAEGLPQREIAGVLGVHESTVSRDVALAAARHQPEAAADQAEESAGALSDASGVATDGATPRFVVVDRDTGEVVQDAKSRRAVGGALGGMSPPRGARGGGPPDRQGVVTWKQAMSY